MIRWFLPIVVFAGGMLSLLFITLFFPVVDQSAANLAGNVTAEAIDTSHFFGWTWASSAGTIKWLIFFGTILLTCLAAAKEFVRQR